MSNMKRYMRWLHCACSSWLLKVVSFLDNKYFVCRSIVSSSGTQSLHANQITNAQNTTIQQLPYHYWFLYILIPASHVLRTHISAICTSYFFNHQYFTILLLSSLFLTSFLFFFNYYLISSRSMYSMISLRFFFI